MQNEYRIDEFIDSHKNEMIGFLEDLIRIPSVRGEQKPDMPYGEEINRALRFTQDKAEKMGFKTENFENRICKVSYSSEYENLGILCHLDIVNVNELKWKTPPFEPVIKDNMIFGRGASDNKGPSAAALYALYAVKKLNIPLKYGVGLYFGTDEESGMSDFKQYLLNNTLPENVFVPDACFPTGVTEKGSVQLCGSCETVSDKIIYADAGESINIIPGKAVAKLKNISVYEVESILLKIKGIKYEIAKADDIITVKIDGRSAHSADPQNGINAASALMELLSGIDKSNLVFEKISNSFGYGLLYGEGFGLQDKRTTISLTGVNYKDGKFKINIDSRVHFSESAEKIFEIIKDKLPLKVNIIHMVEPHTVSRNHKIVNTLQKIYREQTKRDDEPYDMNAMTYAHLKPDAVIFGGVMYEDGSCNAHGENECYNLETLVTAAKMFAKVIVEICG